MADIWRNSPQTSSHAVWLSFKILLLLLLLAAGVLPPLGLGVRHWFLCATADPDLPLWDAFYYFTGAKQYMRAVYCSLRLLFMRLWYGVLFVTPSVAGLLLFYKLYAQSDTNVGVFVGALGLMLCFLALIVSIAALFIFLQRYFLVIEYLCQGMSVKQCFKQSVATMCKKKAATTKLWLSYGIMLLSCVLIVPALYVVPHFLCAGSIMAKLFAAPHTS